MQEKNLRSLPGVLMLPMPFFIIGYIVYNTYNNWIGISSGIDLAEPIVTSLLLLVLFFICLSGFKVVQPNQFLVFTFMGKYRGSMKNNGFFFINPFYHSNKGSLKIGNHETNHLTVNEKGGTPIEIGAIVSYKVENTYKAFFEVSDLEIYVANQFEISLRAHAKKHTYNELSTDDHEFLDDLNQKVALAGIKVIEAKISHLSYAAEIAGAMLQRQQAEAMSEAKKIIVENAIDIANHASQELPGLTSKQRGVFMSNLILVLSSHKEVSPVISVASVDEEN